MYPGPSVTAVSFSPGRARERERYRKRSTLLPKPRLSPPRVSASTKAPQLSKKFGIPHKLAARERERHLYPPLTMPNFGPDRRRSKKTLAIPLKVVVFGINWLTSLIGGNEGGARAVALGVGLWRRAEVAVLFI